MSASIESDMESYTEWSKSQVPDYTKKCSNTTCHCCKKYDNIDLKLKTLESKLEFMELTIEMIRSKISEISKVSCPVPVPADSKFCPIQQELLEFSPQPETTISSTITEKKSSEEVISPFTKITTCSPAFNLNYRIENTNKYKDNLNFIIEDNNGNILGRFRSDCEEKIFPRDGKFFKIKPMTIDPKGQWCQRSKDWYRYWRGKQCPVCYTIIQHEKIKSAYQVPPESYNHILELPEDITSLESNIHVDCDLFTKVLKNFKKV